MKALIVTANAVDCELACGFLQEEGIDAAACATLAEAAGRVGVDVDCLVLVEEALAEPDVDLLQAALARQPPWSDLPVLLLASQESSLAVLVERVFPDTGNVTLLQRPLHPVTLVSSVRMALRARQRQHEVHALLEERSLALRQRDQFLAMLAHELRNPLAPIRNAAFLMRTLDVPDPMFAKCRAMIEKQSAHITRLVDDLLDVSRLELGKVALKRQPTDLNQSLAAAVEACVPMTSAMAHRVVVEPSPEPLMVFVDPVRIEQVVGNLVVNAAKFTPAGGEIRVRARREGETAVAEVEDSGKGIRPEMLQAVFELFVQEQTTLARTQGGLGLGLTLVRRLVELHGGSVTAHSEGLGCGSRFEVRLPMIAEAVPRRRAIDPIRPATKPKRVLVVEDIPEIRESLGMILTVWGHEVTYASTGPEGVALARDGRPDVALIDIGLPELDGFGVARDIRRSGDAWARKVRLYAVTGYGDAGDRDRALEAGFDHHLLKPVDPEVLQRLLQD